MTGDIGNPWRPYTRSEWERARSAHLDGANGYTFTPRDVERIEATLESGFAPEPVTEAQVRRWVGMMDGLISERPNFGRDDLGLVVDAATRVGLALTIETWGAHPNEHYRVRAYGKSTEYNCGSLALAARTIAALAYARAKGEDVSHLLRGES